MILNWFSSVVFKQVAVAHKACRQLYLDVVYRPNLKYFQSELELFRSPRVQITLSAPELDCKLSAIIATRLLLNYSLVSAWPTFHFQSMKVTVCDPRPSCSAFSAATQTAIVSAAFFHKHPQWIVCVCMDFGGFPTSLSMLSLIVQISKQSNRVSSKF